ncbi:MAG: DEAD/DEAH box helicase family protein [Chloroflexota bacterium]
MSEDFFSKPILNSPYEYPARHWELDEDGQPTNTILDYRRSAKFVTPVPKPRKRKDRKTAEYQQATLAIGAEGVTTADRQFDTTSMVNAIRTRVDRWRLIPNPADWRVTPETARLLQHWRHHPFQGIRPFFCQIEAVETMIWLTEVAPRMGKAELALLETIQDANAEANPDLDRVALKLATGAGKTMVMAMIIAWQTINAVRHPQSDRFTRGFLVITPGITIRDRLRVLYPNDPDSYYAARELVPPDLLPELGKAKIVVTNFHAFKRRETLDLARGTRNLLQGRGPALETVESEGQMLQRVMPELMTMKRILVLNDEAHHCYRERTLTEEEKLAGDELEEAKKNNEAARLWINGIEAVSRTLGGENPGIRKVIDLSATPFFLRGSGYPEGTLFHWTASDFSLMDAIECGIVKLPRVPVADNVPGGDMPKFRNLWEHIRTRMPKKGRGKMATLDPLSLPAELQTALDALYGHYARTYDLWQEAGIPTPPVFIVVCNNTSTSKLVYDYIGGFERQTGDRTNFHEGRLSLFRNYDEQGNRLARPMTLLIDSEQLESGDALDDNFRAMAADEIDRFRRELRARGDMATAEKITDQDLLREVMNTVGKEGRLGESVRCVVSVGMLTEGWDCNTVTHILGIRAFGTQLLCEQVVGRALRRQSYELDEEGRFSVEYADVLGIPFDFTAQPVVAPPKKPRRTIQVQAVRPHRDHLEITFPRVTGYRVELPETRLSARFNADSVLELNPLLVGPSVTENRGIVGESVDLTVRHLGQMREATIVYRLTSYLLYNKFRDPGEEPKLHLFGQLKAITRQWLADCLHCTGGTYPAQVLYQEIADMACERIKAAITEAIEGDKPVLATLDAYNPTGSSRFINFSTSKATRWQTDPRKCPVNWIICDSDWEVEFCRVVERHPRVLAYVANQGLGFEVPYLFKAVKRTYIPDFIVRIDDGRGPDDLLNLVVEIKGYRKEDAKEKANTMRTQWVPGVNNLKTHGRWAHAEFMAVFEMEKEFDELIARFVAEGEKV